MTVKDPAFLPPELLVRSPDLGNRRTALVSLAYAPQPHQRELLEEYLHDPDPVSALLAYLGLRKLLPPTITHETTWREVFQESIDLLGKRAVTGPAQLRVAALQALSFAPGGVSTSVVETALQHFSNAGIDGCLSELPPALSLINTSTSNDLSDGLALVLTAMPVGPGKAALFKREIRHTSPDRILPALLALQVSPSREFVDLLLPLTRSHHSLISIEAVKALLKCGGAKTFFVGSSLLQETADPLKKAALLKALARIGKEETWNLLTQHLTHSSPVVRQAAIEAFFEYPTRTSEKQALLNPLLEDPLSGIQIEAARCLWHLGSLEALPRLERFLLRGSPVERAAAAEALGKLPPHVALSPLIESLSHEKSGDAKRAALLSLRQLLPQSAQSPQLIERLEVPLQRLLEQADPFLRSQAGVLCGFLGRPAEDMVIAALEREEHPHVLASLLTALGKTGNPRTLLLARFHQHPDPRVRANLMDAFSQSGSGAIPYLTGALRDASPRVRAAAARNLFQLGQFEVIGILHRMLLIPSPVPVLSACFALGRCFRYSCVPFSASHPMAIALQRIIQKRRSSMTDLPSLLRESMLATVFHLLARAGKNWREVDAVLADHLEKYPDSHALRRLRSSILMVLNRPGDALPLLEQCLQEYPTILADQFDAYRLSLMVGDIRRVETYKTIILRNYENHLLACKSLCQDLQGAGAEEMLEKLHHLRSPSMNLYNAMIQVKTRQGELDIVADLLAELVLARPTNGMIAQKLSTMLPDTAPELKAALLAYATRLIS
jgi:HEAT repeat protein